MKICIKSSFYISRVFKPSIDTDLPTITPRPADTAPVNRYQHSQSQIAIHAVNWPCNSGHAISRLLHCGLCEHNFSGPVSFTNTTRALSREPCKRLLLTGHTDKCSAYKNLFYSQWCSGKYLFAGTHCERGARAYNGGLEAEPPAGSRGRAPGEGQGAKPP